MNRYRMMPTYRFYDLEGTSPLTLDKSVGKPLRDYRIYGNSIQNGTPSPTNSVEVESVGDLVTDEEDLNYGKYKIPVKIGEEITNIYLDAPLRRVSNCTDYIDYINNKVVRNIFEYVFTGEEQWAAPVNRLTNTIRSYTRSPVISGGVRTNYFLLGKSEKGIFDGSGTVAGDKARCQYTLAGAFYARINLSDCADPENPTAQDFQNIYTKGTKIYGVMAEPVEEEVSLPIIKTHKGTNIITVNTDISPYNMAVQYYK